MSEGDRDLLSTLEHLLEIPAVDERIALTEASNVIQRALAGDKVDVFVHDPTIDSLVAMGTSLTPMGRKQHELGLDRLPLANGGRSVQVFKTGGTHLHGRAPDDPEELRGLSEALGINSRLVAPLYVDSVRRGTLEVCAAAPDKFDQADLRFLMAASRWVGALLHRVELATETRKRAVEEARRKAAEDILAVLAHDLRNLLGSAAGRVALLRERAIREHREADVRDAGLLDVTLRRLVQMTNNLLDVSRLERGIFSLDARLVDIVDLARQTTAALRRTGVQIEEQYPESVIVNADPDRLSRALENLISNAIKHSPQDGVIRVEIEMAADPGAARCVIRVVDQGPGIPSEILPRIFERFVAGTGSHGLGLGLYLARGIAVAHGGSLEVKPSTKGAVFEMSLPVLA
jgi:signal transduction histidine kinase